MRTRNGWPTRAHSHPDRRRDARPLARRPSGEGPPDDREGSDRQEDPDQVEQPVAVPEAVVGDDANGFAGLAAPVGLEQ